MKKSKAKFKKRKKRLFLITTAPPPEMKTTKHSKAIYLLLLGGTGGEIRALLELPEPNSETDPAKTAPLSRREVH